MYGADINDFSEYHPGVERLVCDFTVGIPLPAESLDLVVSHSVLEHVDDVPRVLANIDRVLRVGGYFYATVSPLYYAATGAHINQPKKLANWEHLDPASPYYLLDNPMPGAVTLGHGLNGMRWSDFLGWAGAQPWSIVGSRLLFLDQPLPSWIDRQRHREIDLRLQGFAVLFRKERRLV